MIVKIFVFLFITFLKFVSSSENCLVPGYCLGGLTLVQEIATNLDDCGSFCDNEEGCVYYTFFTSDNVCFLYATCPDIFDDPSLPSITSEKGCPTDFCYYTGSQCNGNLIAISKTADEYECLETCVDNNDCGWFEFDTGTKFCSLFETCATYGQDCPNCIIGSRDCPLADDEMVLLLGLGEEKYYVARNDFDLVKIDPADSTTYGVYCDPLANFSSSGAYSSGEYAHGKIITCGGYLFGSYSKACYYYSGNSWEYFGDLDNFKVNHDSAILPNGDLWVTGGYNGDNDVLSSTDIVDQYLNIKRGPDLPLEVQYHCMVNWNSSHMLLTGGTVGGTGFDLKLTFFFDVENEIWLEGPSMNHEHTNHGCVSFEDTDGKKKVMVVGTLGGFYTTTTELFDGDSWTTTTETPISMAYVKAVAYKGKVTVTGREANGYTDPLEQAWVFDIATKTWSAGFSMSPPIAYHNSFLVPKSYCN